MNGRIGPLLILAVIQLVLVGVLLVNRGTSEDGEATLLAFDSANVDRLIIHPPTVAEETDIGSDDEAKEPAALELTKADSGWQVGDYPADDAKVSEVLQKFAEFTAPWPVATTSGSQTRFEVSDDAYQKRFQLYADDEQMADVFLGTSPGYKRVHARRAGSEDIFSINFSNFELPTSVDDWLDNALLQVNTPIDRLALDDRWVLERSGDSWLVNGEPADTEAVDEMLERFAELRVLNLTEPQGELKGTFTLTAADGAEQTIELRHIADEDDYVISGSAHDGHFTFATYIAEQMLIDADEFVAGVSEDATPSGEEIVGDPVQDVLDDAIKASGS